MKNLIRLTIISLVIMSCKTQKIEPIQTSIYHLPKKVVKRYDYTTKTLTFKYNQNNLVSEINVKDSLNNSEVIIKYSYLENKLTSKTEAYYTSDPNSWNVTRTFVYEYKDNLLTTVNTFYDNNLNSSSNIKYDNESKIKYIIHSQNNASINDSLFFSSNSDIKITNNTLNQGIITVKTYDKSKTLKDSSRYNLENSKSIYEYWNSFDTYKKNEINFIDKKVRFQSEIFSTIFPSYYENSVEEVFLNNFYNNKIILNTNSLNNNDPSTCENSYIFYNFDKLIQYSNCTNKNSPLNIYIFY